jgi:Pyruvate/2-oxoacid:ferredoxin oxidoreductase delta subunit
MHAEKIFLAVFTGTGNTLVAANALADTLRRAGKTVTLVPMHRDSGADALARAGFGEGDALGIAVTVAAFSTYPAAWRFIESLPDGNGREAFFLATMGGMGFTLHGPIGRAVRRKGYVTIAARCARACGNYGTGVPAPTTLPAVQMRLRKWAEQYAADLLSGSARWGSGWYNPLAPLFAWTAKTGRSFKTFRRVFPLAVDAAKCTGCGLCARQCPAQAIAMTDGKAVLDGAACQSCQRCIAYCPAHAIGVPGKEMRQHRPVSSEEMTKFLATL